MCLSAFPSLTTTTACKPPPLGALWWESPPSLDPDASRTLALSFQYAELLRGFSAHQVAESTIPARSSRRVSRRRNKPAVYSEYKGGRVPAVFLLGQEESG